ncbi:MAG: MBL fold metallo-hydrolase [Hyphomicrobiaceae bacterium]|nr:MBL fold metallo-hydrolase [Hyphomicrobiaceae bacterium]
MAPGADAGPGADQCALRLTVLGCGDAFGSGGRLQSSYHVEAPQGTFLLDCGVTALIGMQRLRLDPNAVGCILVSHLHGDHFGGLVWWLLHSHYASNRTGPLTIAGPAGIRERVHAAAEAMFPGSAALELRYRLEYREFVNRAPLAIGGLAVTPFEARHPSGAPAHALRIETGGRCLSFSGDTEWVEDLVPCAKGADLFIIDCFGWDSDIGSHMSWKTISSRLDALVARRLMLTHMGPEMLARLGEVRDPRFLAAEDGLVVELSGESGARAPVGA